MSRPLPPERPIPPLLRAVLPPPLNLFRRHRRRGKRSARKRTGLGAQARVLASRTRRAPWVLRLGRGSSWAMAGSFGLVVRGEQVDADKLEHKER